MKTSYYLDSVEHGLGTISKMSAEYSPEQFRDDTLGMTVTEAARMQKKLSEMKEMCDVVSKTINKLYDFIRYTRLPEVMEIEDMESVKLEGVGRVYLLSDVNVSTKAGMKESAIEWLIENGFGDIVQETVNSSTLKAVIKGVIKEGNEVPEEFFNVSPFTRAQITK